MAVEKDPRLQLLIQKHHKQKPNSLSSWRNSKAVPWLLAVGLALIAYTFIHSIYKSWPNSRALSFIAISYTIALLLLWWLHKSPGKDDTEPETPTTPPKTTPTSLSLLQLTSFTLLMYSSIDAIFQFRESDLATLVLYVGFCLDLFSLLFFLSGVFEGTPNLMNSVGKARLKVAVRASLFFRSMTLVAPQTLTGAIWGPAAALTAAAGFYTVLFDCPISGDTTESAAAPSPTLAER